jgi:hypothetical protein
VRSFLRGAVDFPIWDGQEEGVEEDLRVNRRSVEELNWTGSRGTESFSFPRRSVREIREQERTAGGNLLERSLALGGHHCELT